MRKLFEKRMDVLTDLHVFYDGDHRQKELSISCESAHVTGTGRKVTEKQLSGLAQVLHCKPQDFTYALQTPVSYNLLNGSTICQLVFSFHTLVGIADKDGLTYCDLATGDVIDEKLLFIRCRLRAQERKLEEIKFLKRRLDEEMKVYQEIKNAKF